MKRAASSNAWPADGSSRSSAAQPPFKRRRDTVRRLEEARPNRREETPDPEDAPPDTEGHQLHCTIKFIELPPMKLHEQKTRDAVLHIIQSAIAKNVDILNMSFAKASDIKILEQDIIDLTAGILEGSDYTDSSPYRYWTDGGLLTLYSPWCGQCETLLGKTILFDHQIPAICLAFDTPAGRIININARWPHLQSKRKQDVLERYVSIIQQEANPKQVIQVIGGQLGRPVVLQSIAEQLGRTAGLHYQLAVVRLDEEQSNVQALTKNGGLQTF